MKSFFKNVREIAVSLIFLPIGLFLVIAMFPIILIIFLTYLNGKLWARLRNDPKHTPLACYQIYSNSTYPESEGGLREYFNEYLNILTKACNLEDPLEIMTEGFDDLAETIETQYDTHFVSLSTKLRLKDKVIDIKMEADGVSRDDGTMFTAANDPDVPPYLEIVFRQGDNLRTVFEVSGADTLEFFIASINNGQMISEAGQVWVKIKKGLYMVNYAVRNPEKSDRLGGDYGYRRVFSDKKARQYFFDEK
jgi:hypothetical protein